jgi:hypothetical protein
MSRPTYNLWWTHGQQCGVMTIVGVSFTLDLVTSLRAKGYTVEVEKVQ